MQDFFDRIDPELRSAFPADAPDITTPILRDVVAARLALANARADNLKDVPAFDGTASHKSIAMQGGGTADYICFEKASVTFDDCVVIWLHGGGYLLGSADDPAVGLFADLAPIISVDYALAPEARAPLAAQQVCAVIQHVADTMKPRKIALAGASAGGGLAASAALMNRDLHGPELAMQLLLYPMIDDRHDTPSGHWELPDNIWNRNLSLHAWSLYRPLDDTACPPSKGYAAATYADNLKDLPPTYIMCGDMDIFLDENLAFAGRLRDANIPVETAIYPGAPHGFNGFAPRAQVSKRANLAMRLAMEQALS